MAKHKYGGDVGPLFWHIFHLLVGLFNYLYLIYILSYCSFTMFPFVFKAKYTKYLWKALRGKCCMFLLISYVFNRLDWIYRTCLANDDLSQLTSSTDNAFLISYVIRWHTFMIPVANRPHEFWRGPIQYRLVFIISHLGPIQ